jgi:hypothetical protein
MRADAVFRPLPHLVAELALGVDRRPALGVAEFLGRGGKGRGGEAEGKKRDLRPCCPCHSE